ncbi:MAG: hypothetical protein J0H66_03845 [Solirubrobacterales bacterium]|nr:hypothetical protein [Solirubrobacterales bacterium]OJU96224.1 MAG: hypothetical protein BGO23_01510 [Solirubrobacterales bacterium 67-14]
MSPGRLAPWLIGSALVILLAGTAGWVIGAGAATGKRDARSAHDRGYAEGFELVFAGAHRETARRGFTAGAKRGKLAGAKTGSREGWTIGAGNAGIEQAVESQKAAESSASSAESEIAARQANCGVVPAAPSWCPTSSELDAYKQAVRAAKEAAEQAEKEKEQKKPRPPGAAQ